MLDDLTKEQILDLVDTTLEWGDEVAEKWVGTQYEKRIRHQKNYLLNSVENKDLSATKDILVDLAQFLHESEEEYKRVEG